MSPKEGVEEQDRKSLVEVCRMRHCADYRLHQQSRTGKKRMPSTCWMRSARPDSDSRVTPLSWPIGIELRFQRRLQPLRRRLSILKRTANRKKRSIH
ncbi:MAG: hypothetical protein U0T81_12360 [Saprospiraceae bacterium]